MRNAIRGICLLCLFCLLFCWGCGPKPPDATAPFRDVWSGVLEGTLHKTAFCAAVTLTPVESGWQAEVVFRAPTLLESTTLHALIDANGQPSGSVELLHAQKAIVLDAVALEGLLLPAVALLDGRNVVSLQKNGDVFLLSLPNGAILTVSQSGQPLSYQSTDLSFTVVE